MYENDFWKVCEALDCEKRIEILQYLIGIKSTESPSVCELANLLQTSEPAMSLHLKKLATAGLIASKRTKRCIHYRVSPATPACAHVIDAFRKFFASHPSGKRRREFHAYVHALSHHRRNAIVRCLNDAPGLDLKTLAKRTDMPPQTIDRLWGDLEKVQIVDLSGHVFSPVEEPEATLLASTLSGTGSHL